jgi:plastocyanin
MEDNMNDDAQVPQQKEKVPTSARLNGVRIAGVIAILLLIITVGVFASTAFAPKKSTVAPAETSSCNKELNIKSVMLTYTKDNEFSPHCITISSGTTIMYMNESDTELEVGADPHPIHTGDRELSNGEFVLTVQPGASASAVVSKVGTFGIHNHLNPSATATVIIQ